MKLTLVKLLLPLSGLPTALAGPLFNGRGVVFEDALRKQCCTKKLCTPESCANFKSCPIPVLIARNISPDPYLLKKHQKPGLPYVLRREDDRHQLSLVLLGSAIAHLPLFLEILLPQSGSHAAYPLCALDNQGSPLPILFDGDGTVQNLPLLEAGQLLDRFCIDFHGCQRIRIDLATPLQMVRGGRELNRFDPHFFIRSLLRRSPPWQPTTVRGLIATISGILPVWLERYVFCVRLLSGIRLLRGEE